VAANVLIESDLRGIESHGVARFERAYLNRVKAEEINPRPNIRIVNQSPSTALVDADGGLGMVTAYRCMNIAIQKAAEVGSGFVTATNCRHFGIAGYYSSMALPHDMMGISMCNTGGMGNMVPTFGSAGRLGTNPISVAIPAEKGTPFLLDMATTAVSTGKLETYTRKGVPIPEGWAMDEEGRFITDPVQSRQARHYAPLGSRPETSSYKGFGLGLWVEIFCAILPGHGGALVGSPGTGHFFGAWRVDGFRAADQFKAMMDQALDFMRATPPAHGHDRVYVAGDLEHIAKEERKAKGIPLFADTIESLRRVSAAMGVPIEL
ncbi:MAG: Malate/L-lactate dehydrogenase, partial [Dehalococcoidia bacterium]|nr:Malate/L-lactate dehydrogenase [Dehalococcoidia bacterium]